MKTSAHLVSEYATADRDHRLQLIEEMIDCSAVQVVNTLTRGILDQDEDEYVRLAILQSMPFRIDPPHLRLLIAKALCDLLTRCDEVLIRQHAGLALRAFVDCAGVLDELESFVRNPTVESTIRENALAALEFNAYESPECHKLLVRLAAATEFGPRIQTFLNLLESSD
ncbi:MAG: hypothetical protein JSS02_33085 [Planctomycetes bacterium]|nr:hypothetical protein [Planctomycetota bacterium]